MIRPGQLQRERTRARSQRLLTGQSGASALRLDEQRPQATRTSTAELPSCCTIAEGRQLEAGGRQDQRSTSLLLLVLILPLAVGSRSLGLQGKVGLH